MYSVTACHTIPFIDIVSLDNTVLYGQYTIYRIDTVEGSFDKILWKDIQHYIREGQWCMMVGILTLRYCSGKMDRECEPVMVPNSPLPYDQVLSGSGWKVYSNFTSVEK